MSQIDHRQRLRSEGRLSGVPAEAVDLSFEPSNIVGRVTVAQQNEMATRGLRQTPDDMEPFVEDTQEFVPQAGPPVAPVAPPVPPAAPPAVPVPPPMAQPELPQQVPSPAPAPTPVPFEDEQAETEEI